MSSSPDIERQIEQLGRRAERIISLDELRKKLSSGRQLRIKLGMDPTAADVTLGHCVPLKIIRQFQEWGHKAVLIIGDYTARVGDPSGRNELRPQLDPAQIDANATTYVAQVGKVLLSDAENLEVRYNGEWLAKMNLVDIIRLAGRKTLKQVLQRDDFAQRFKSETEIHLHELLYPLLQGWDSVQIRADVEMGGSDQLFNNLVGRDFQKDESQEPQVVIVTPLLIGTDGAAKMSKSKGNYIAVTDPPGGDNGMFGKVMRLPDQLMESYYTLLTDIAAEEFRPLIQQSPRDAKVRLAKHLITWLHDAASADKAEQEFRRATHGGVPEEIRNFRYSEIQALLREVLCKAGLAVSISEARRKIREGAVRLDGQKVADENTELIIGRPGETLYMKKDVPQLSVEKPFVLQVGTRRFVRIV